MLDLIPPYYLVALGLGLAAIVVVLFYSFTRTTNYEVQQKLKKLSNGSNSRTPTIKKPELHAEPITNQG